MVGYREEKAFSRQQQNSADPEIGYRQSFPKSWIDHVDQVLPVGGDEGTVVGRQTHGLGLLVTQAVGHVQPHHVARVGLVQRHQVELRARRRRSSVKTTPLLSAPLKPASTFCSAVLFNSVHSRAGKPKGFAPSCLLLSDKQLEAKMRG